MIRCCQWARRIQPTALALLILFLSAHAFAQTAPQLPERTVDAREPAAVAGGRTVAVHAGANLQRALDRAAPGDTLALDPGATFEGSFTLPRKDKGTGWITIRSSGHLPPEGTRVTPADSIQMPKIVAAAGPALIAAPGASHYRFVGLEILPRDGEFSYVLVQLGDNSMLTSDLPRELIFARCYVHGDPLFGSRRGFAMNSGAAAVVDSYLSDFKEAGNDSQAIAGWSGTGPFLIANDYLEGAGENVLFGGADAPGPGRVPSDIEIKDNLFDKPLSWKSGSPTFSGAAWTIKNLLELKDARRVLIQDNRFEHNWAQAQSGFAILFTVRNQEGTAPFSVVEDVTFQGNTVSDAGNGINILGRDDTHNLQSEQTKRISIRDNFFADLGAAWGGNGTLFQLLQGPADIDIEHNTAFQSGSVVMTEGPPNRGFVFRNNLVLHNAYGITGSGAGIGTGALEAYFPGAVVQGNVFIGGDAARYPKGNQFVSSIDAVFSDPAHKKPRAPYASAGVPRRD